MERAPVFVVAPPCSGQVALRESLLLAPGTWRAPTFAGLVIAGPSSEPTSGDRLGAVPDESARARVRDLVRAQRGRAAHVDAGNDTTLISAEPVLALWVPFLASVFPDARFVYLHRDPSAAVAGAIDEWETDSNGRELPDPRWRGRPWSLPLIPGWRELGDQSLAEVVAAQWASVATIALDDLEALDSDRWFMADTSELVANPETELQRIFRFAGLGWHQVTTGPWRTLGRVSTPGLLRERLSDDRRDALALVVDRVEALLTAPPLEADDVAQTPDASDHGLGRHLKLAGLSLLTSTYQANRLIVLRHDRGSLGVHLRAFDRPMGIATTPGGLAIGTRAELLDYRDFPAMAANADPGAGHDAYFIRRNSHVTGDIAVHDVALARGELWVVATQFSCLATIDSDHSFVPRWVPPFISSLAPEDRCHLNGMAVVDGIPRYVTALGATDTPGGWRPHKAQGGVVIDVASGETVVRGLSMPHSPRWHDGRLWVLDSGRGHLVVCDLDSGQFEAVAALPGFTRGLRFAGTTAYVGTSQVRETATFGDLDIASMPVRECGVWAVDTRTGETLGSVRFERHIQEIFDVEVLVGKRFPEVLEPDSPLNRGAWFVPGPSGQPS